MIPQYEMNGFGYTELQICLFFQSFSKQLAVILRICIDNRVLIQGR